MYVSYIFYFIKELFIMKDRIIQINEFACRFFQRNLNGAALDYCLKQRKMHPNVIQRFQLGYAPDDWTELYKALVQNGYSEAEIEASTVCKRGKNGRMYDFYRDRIIFPIRDLQDNCIGFGGRTWKRGDERPKYINTSETEAYHKGSTLYGLNNVPKPAKYIIICEGYMDCIALQSNGFTTAVAGLGTALTLEQSLLIESFTREVYLLYDNDLAGLEATKKAVSIFKTIGIEPKIVFMKGAKDADEYLKSFSAQRFAQDILFKSGSVFDFNLKYNCIKYKNTPNEMYQRNMNTILNHLYSYV